MRTDNDKLEALKQERGEVAADLRGINPSLSLATKLRERLRGIDAEIKAFDEKRLHITPFKPSQITETIPSMA